MPLPVGRYLLASGVLEVRASGLTWARLVSAEVVGDTVVGRAGDRAFTFRLAASERDAVFFAPTTYEVDMDALEPHRLALDGFAQLRTQHDTLGEAEVVAAYQHAHETLVQSVRKTSNVLLTTVAVVKYRRRVLLAMTRKTVNELWSQA